MTITWIAPAAGDLLNPSTAQPWRRGDVVQLQLQLGGSSIGSLDRVELIGGQLPPGLFFNSALNRVQGTVAPLPKNITEYPVIFRAFLENSSRTYDRSVRWLVAPIDEEQRWDNPFNPIDPNNPTQPVAAFLGQVNRGSNVIIQLDVINPDGDPLDYKAVGYQGPPGSKSGLPFGLEVDPFGRIVGSPTITNNEPGDYYFRIYVRDPDGLLSNPRGEGSPRTSEKIYRINVTSDIVLDARLSDVVRWETSEGSLGSCWETYPSHFAVKAVPQFQVSQGNATEDQQIRYTLVANRGSLPSGLLLDQKSGLIIGRCPYVAVSRTFEFTVEARVVFVNRLTDQERPSSIASQRTFSITVLSRFNIDSVTSLQMNVPGPAREKIAKWIWGNLPESRANYQSSQRVHTANGSETTFEIPSGISRDTIDVMVDEVLVRNYTRIFQGDREFIVFSTPPVSGSTVKILRFTNTTNSIGTDQLTILGRNQIYREIDPFFGKLREYRITLVSGLNYRTGELIEELKDYHRPFDLRIGGIASARAESPDGQHIYDVIYLGLIDPLEGAGGFNTINQEENLTRYNNGQRPIAIPAWNLTAGNTNYYPTSIKNLRADLVNRTGRLTRTESIRVSSIEHFASNQSIRVSNTSVSRSQGYGFAGLEGLSLWQMTEQTRNRPETIPGYQSVIELAYVRAGAGPAIVRALTTAGINEDLQGTTIRVDRYLLLSDGFLSLTFDGPDTQVVSDPIRVSSIEYFASDEITTVGQLPTVITLTDFTTFDGPNNPSTPTQEFTSFDTFLQSESKYYKFPPGDKI